MANARLAPAFKALASSSAYSSEAADIVAALPTLDHTAQARAFGAPPLKRRVQRGPWRGEGLALALALRASDVGR